MLPATPTQSHQRIRLQTTPGAIVIHGTVIPGTYSPTANTFQASLDTQNATDAPLQLTPVAGQVGKYTDQNGIVWTLIN